MIWIVPRTNQIFLANGTIYFLTVAVNLSKLLRQIHKKTSNRCKNLLRKSMYAFRECLTNHEEVPVRNSDGRFQGNEVYLRKARSEENIYRHSDPWISPDYAERYFSSHSNSAFLFTDPSMFSSHLGSNSPYLTHIPLPPSGVLLPQSPQTFLAPQTTHAIQNRYYLRRTDSVDNNTDYNLDDMSKIMRVLSKRYWQETKNGRKSSKRCFEFTLMSYNVLAQSLLDEHPHLYRQHDHRALKWCTRWKNLLNEIKTMRPDVLCLQEVQESHLQTCFGQLESLGYKGVFKKRTGIRCDGCAIYYRQDRLSLIEYETVEFYQPNVDVLNRDNIAIMVKLSPASAPKRHFIVANTHLLYNPRRQDVRLAQTQLLLTEVERMSFHWNSKGKGKYWPIIITGDFNSTPDSAVCELITKGKLKYDHLAARKMHIAETPRHGSVLVPSHLEITDSCQHACLVEKRRKNQDISRNEEAALIKLHNSDKTVTKISSEVIKNPEMFSTGTLSHLFALKSAYSHGEPNNPEGTTFQDEWITVDYIFYSAKKQEGQIDDHKLKLMSTYRLPLRNELDAIRIPNRLLGSDHLCLAAKFRMKI